MIKSELLHSTAFRTILRFLLIAPFNIFIIAIPGLVTFGLILLAWALVIGLLSITLATPVIAVQTELIFLSFWTTTAVFSTSLFAFFMAICLSFFVFYATKHFAIYMLDYLNWNLRFIFQKKKKV